MGWHDHACVGAAEVYSVVVAVALGLSVLVFGACLAERAAGALWSRLARLTARLWRSDHA